MLLRRWLENWPVFTITLSPDSITCTGTFSPDGKSITHPLVSAVAVSVYLVADVSFPDSGVAGAAAAAFVVSCGASFLAHAATRKRAEHSIALRRIACMVASGMRGR